MTSFLDRLLGRPEPPRARKAAFTVGSWLPNSNGLSTLRGTDQEKAAAYLRAYKVGWFYKAGKKIADDIASLDWSLSDGDMEEGEAETTLDRPDLPVDFDSLAPIDQFQRLLERPNPRQTGRQLFRKTQVRLDFAGCAAWYLANGDGPSGLPTEIYGVSPSRLWPSYDKDGQLIGWVLDRDKPSGGTPFSANEILWFSVGNAEDDDLFGTSVVEAVYSQVPMTDMMARHTANVLATGGRLAGMLSPKERALGPDEFDDVVKAWRNVASDPDSAKRLLVFPEPMEYTPGASTPAEIGIPELAILTRDEILTAFPVGPEMLGVPMPSGLNASGESRLALRKFYWEDTIHPRADLLEEVIQVGLLSRYENLLGQTYDFEIAEPNLDDPLSLTAKVEAFKGLIAVGFDPKESVKAVALDHIKWSKPEPVAPPPPGEPEAPEDEEPEPTPPAKAQKVPYESLVSKFLTDQRDRISGRLRVSLPSGKASARREYVKADDDWWDGGAEDKALRDTLRTLYLEVGREGLQVVADKLGRFVFSPAVNRITQDLVEYGGSRITEINERTRDAIKAELIEGTRRGYSIEQLLSGVEAEGFGGVQGALMDNGVPVFDKYRAEMIARTETQLSMNRAAIRGYGEFGVKEVQAIDGHDDAECAARNGVVFSVDEALGITDHPNGTLDWIPVLDKAVHEPHEPMTVAPVTNIHIGMPELKVVNEPPTINVTNEVPTPSVSVVNEVVSPSVNVTNDVKTPDVHVTNEVVSPSVTVKAPQVTVNNEVVTPTVNVTNEVQTPRVTVKAPEVHVTNEVVSPEVHVTTPEVTVNVPPAAPRTVKRDANDRIIGLE